jgi:phage host-nuclease inhibitor protein Gam
MSTTKTTPVSYDAAKIAAESYRLNAQKLARIESDLRAQQSALAAKVEAERNKLKLAMENAAKQLEHYSNENRENLMGDKKSTEFMGVKLKYSSSTSLAAVSGTFKEVLERISKDRKFKKYLRTKVEINKPSIKKATAEELQEMGLEYKTTETFAVDV